MTPSQRFTFLLLLAALQSSCHSVQEVEHTRILATLLSSIPTHLTNVTEMELTHMKPIAQWLFPALSAGSREVETVAELMVIHSKYVEHRAELLGLDYSPQVTEPNCDPVPTPRPNNISELTPYWVEIVAAMGDSISAGFAAKSTNLWGLKEFRGLSWSIGGDDEVLTFPNFLSEFTRKPLYGQSLGEGDRHELEDHLNAAISGALVQDMVAQAEWLMNKMQQYLTEDKYNNAWKTVTIWIGGNNLCRYCHNPEMHSPQQYYNSLKMALNFLSQVPKMFVSLVHNIDVTELDKFSTGLCPLLHRYACPCPTSSDPEIRAIIRNVTREYNEKISLIGQEFRHIRDDFAVVVQPFLKDSKIPDETYLSPADCFHPSAKAHAALAVGLWNTVTERPGHKDKKWNPGEEFRCPTPDTRFFM